MKREEIKVKKNGFAWVCVLVCEGVGVSVCVSLSLRRGTCRDAITLPICPYSYSAVVVLM